MNKILIFLLSFYFLSSSASASDELVLDASNSFAITVRKNSQMPIKSLIKQSKAIIIFPSVTKIGLVLGGMRGDGVMLVGDPYSPSEAFGVDINGGSIGLQIGYENSSLILFILKDSIVSDIKSNKVTIKADASFSFGSLGRNYGKISDFSFTSDIYAYASNDGFFAGASFGGAVISKTGNAINTDSYGYNALMSQISKF